MITAFMNMKGGVGKTTLCVHLAGAGAHKGKRILMIDYDPQFNLTQHVLKPKDYFDLENKNKTVYGVLQPQSGQPSPFQVAVSSMDIGPPRLASLTHNLLVVGYRSPNGQVDLVPGSNKMMYLVLGKTEGSTRPMEKRFHQFLESAQNKYDHIFIDCHPAGSFLTKSALMMSDLVVTPVVPDSYSQRGLVLMKEFLEHVSKFSRREPLLKIVFNMIPWSNADQRQEASIRQNAEFEDMCVETVLHYSTPIAKSGQVEGPTWKRMMQWSRRPWKERVKREINSIFEELFES